MRLGIVATDGKYATDIKGLIRAARARGWAIDCFLTDTGVMLLADPEFIEAARQVPKSVAVCEHSMAAQGIPELSSADTEAIVVGGQYQDAELVSRCDRVLVF